ncbi:protein of unknown function [Methylocaldum szegediense]|uniref:Uncharacterized protein n=1 Tax=Methylocaldum szegediense TaxID=73780 RepID=A0ABN8WXA4_9GAMM|nr:protein of unknown function [Methylocaldum szegediense]
MLCACVGFGAIRSLLEHAKSLAGDRRRVPVATVEHARIGRFIGLECFRLVSTVVRAKRMFHWGWDDSSDPYIRVEDVLARAWSALFGNGYKRRSGPERGEGLMCHTFATVAGASAEGSQCRCDRQ